MKNERLLVLNDLDHWSVIQCLFEDLLPPPLQRVHRESRRKIRLCLLLLLHLPLPKKKTTINDQNHLLYLLPEKLHLALALRGQREVVVSNHVLLSDRAETIEIGKEVDVIEKGREKIDVGRINNLLELPPRRPLRKVERGIVGRNKRICYKLVMIN
jgi:hypothetical protein